MKILFMGLDRRNLVALNYLTEFELAVGKFAECKYAGTGFPLHREGETLDETVKRVMPDADWVILYDFEIHATGKYGFPPSQNRSYKVAIHVVDMHRMVEYNIKRLNKLKADAFLMTYTKLAKKLVMQPGHSEYLPAEVNQDFYLENLNAPIMHLAPSISSKWFEGFWEQQDWIEKTKHIDVTFAGSILSYCYPLRNEIFREMKPLCVRHKWTWRRMVNPPGRSLTRKISDLQGKYHVGQKYMELLFYTKILIFGTSIFKYPLYKFIEGWGAGCCVLSDWPLTPEALHLEDRKNFVPIDSNNWKDMLEYYMNHPTERMLIAKNGVETYKKHHTAEIRAKQLVAFLEAHT